MVYAAERRFPDLKIAFDENTFELVVAMTMESPAERLAALNDFIIERCGGSGAFLSRLKEKTYFTTFDGTILAGNSTSMIAEQGVTGAHLLRSDIVRTSRLLDRCLQKFYRDLGAEEVQMPSIVSRRTLVRAGYIPRDAHQVGEIFVQNPDSGAPISSDACLSPALCLSCYAAFEGARLPEPTLLSAAGQVYRYEGGMHGGGDPLTRLWEYRVRELVGFGPVEMVRCVHERYLNFIKNLALTFRLPSRASTAADTFFHGEYAHIAAHQLIGAKKTEFRVNLDLGPLAVSSFNIHDRHFTREFDIGLDVASESTQSFCIGFGLERLAYAMTLAIQDREDRERILIDFERKIANEG
ncbi:MAG: hypothetical protein HC902_01610 [Calothrix sp. SM1_5_4]|nr:hypothetical protein [Calothrix sp. SM1_5_4]